MIGRRSIFWNHREPRESEKSSESLNAITIGHPQFYLLALLLGNLAGIPCGAQTAAPRIATPQFGQSISSPADALVVINWSGGAAPFQVQCRTNLAAPWQDVDGITSAARQTNILTARSAFYRIVSVAAFIASSADRIPPSVPGGLTATVAGSTQINLAWNASTDTGTGATGVKGYNLYRNGIFLKQIPAPALSASDTGLLPSTTYTYAVAAVDNAYNQSARSSPATATTLPTGGCTYSISSTSASAGATGGNGSVSVAASAGCAWTATSTNAWLTIVAGASGSGNGTVTYLVATNTTASARTSTLSIAGQSFTVSQAVDTTAPTVLLSSPSSGAIVSGNVTLIGLASDPVGIGRVEFYRDGAALVGTATASPYSVAEDTTALANGAHSYSAKAYDAAGNWTMSASSAVTVSNAVAGTPGQLQWVRHMVANNRILPGGVAVDHANNTVVGGAYVDYAGYTSDLGGGPLPYAAGLTGFLAKYKAQGGFMWARTLGGVINAVAVDSQNNILVTGYFGGSVDFGGVVLSTSSGLDYDIFVAKYSAGSQGVAGGLVWVKQFGGTQTDIGTAITVDGSDNVLFGGRFCGSASFGGVALNGVGGFDVAVAKLSGANGGTLWARSGGSSANDFVNGLAVDGTGNVVVTGQAGGAINLGGGQIGNGGVFVAKYSGANGSYQWAQVPGGGAGNGVAVEGATGNIFVTGQGGGIFLSAYNSTGGLLWSKVYSSTSTAGQAVAVDGSGNVAMTGLASGVLDFKGDGSYTFSGSYFVASYTTAGVYRWASRPSPSGGVGMGIAYDSTGHLLTAGNFTATADFGGLAISAGSGATDGFLVQYTK